MEKDLNTIASRTRSSKFKKQISENEIYRLNSIEKEPLKRSHRTKSIDEVIPVKLKHRVDSTNEAIPAKRSRRAYTIDASIQTKRICKSESIDVPEHSAVPPKTKPNKVADKNSTMNDNLKKIVEMNMALSNEVNKLKKKLKQTTKDVAVLMEQLEEKTLACLNLDKKIADVKKTIEKLEEERFTDNLIDINTNGNLSLKSLCCICR